MGTEDSIRVVIAEEHGVLREGLRRALNQVEGITIVGEAANADQTIEVVSQLQPDVLLLDLAITRYDGFEVIGLLIRTSPKTKPLILTTSPDHDLTLKRLQAGAKGYLSKDANISELIKAIQALTHGELWVERKMFAQILEQKAFADDGNGRNRRADREQEQLTLREQEIMNLLSAGKTNKEIARTLTISEKTVKSHLNNIFRKLHVRRRLQAVLQALKLKP